MRTVFGAGAVAVALLLAGCASAPTHVFTLTPVPAAHPIPYGSARQPIVVADIPVPATIDRSSIVLNQGNGQLYISPSDEWAGPLGALIRQALTADLQSRLGTGAVLAPGSLAPHGGLRVLKINLQHFMGDTSGRVELEVSWDLLKAGGSDVLRSGYETITTQAASGKVADVVPAMSRAIGILADRIARQIG